MFGLLLQACNPNLNGPSGPTEGGIGSGYSNSSEEETGSSSVSEKLKFDLDQLSIDNKQFQSRNKELLRKEKSLVRGAPLLRLRNSESRLIMIPPQSELVAEIDNDCVRRKGGRSDGENSLSAQFMAGQASLDDLGRQAFALKITEDVTMGKLSELADKDDCVISVANDVKFKTNFVPNDTYYNRQLQLPAINANVGFDTFFAGKSKISANVTVAVLDTGVSSSHPDLAPNLWKDADGSIGYDFYDGDNNPDDVDGHGTFVAGIIGAALNNGIGVAGIMGANIKIMAIKVLSSNGGSTTAIVNGIRYAISKKVDVINMSFAGSGRSFQIEQAMKDAIAQGITIVVAAGNDGFELTNTNWQTPASYSKGLEGLLSVGAIDSVSKTRSWFSNYSNTFVEIGAPGSNGIVSTFVGNGYAIASGTSFSSPMVAGAAGLAIGYLRSQNISHTPALIETLVLDGAAKSATLTNEFKNGNILNLANLATVLVNRFPVGGTPTVTATATPKPTSTATPTMTPKPTSTATPTMTPKPTSTPNPAPTATATPAPSCGKMSSVECEVGRLVNLQRKNNGVPELRILSRCVEAAQYHSQEMADSGFFSHDSPNQSIQQRYAQFGLNGSYWGENIAYGYSTPASVMTTWMSSSGHRANILSRNFKSLGVGAVKARNGRIYWTQCFSGLSGN